MRNLTIGDLKLALRDLLGPNLAQLQLTQTGKLYENRLRAKQQALEDIPDPALRTAPLADALSAKDAHHDGIGSAVHYLCLAIEAHPQLAASLKQAARETREAFVPQLSVLRRPYADEAAAALDHEANGLPRLESAMQTIDVPGGGTLDGWVTAFVQTGHGIDALLRERAKLVHTGENAAIAGPLRSATVGLLGRFRDALRDEIEEAGSVVPQTHEAVLFAYIDQLAAQRAHATTTQPSGATPETPSESNPPV
jgi:hypothetical protein